MEVPDMAVHQLWRRRVLARVSTVDKPLPRELDDILMSIIIGDKLSSLVDDRAVGVIVVIVQILLKGTLFLWQGEVPGAGA
jgi:hypothetical protein